MAAVALSTVSAVKLGYRPTPGSVPWGADATKPEWVDPQDHPVNYFVPNFGVDNDIGSTFKNTADAEEKLGHTLQASFDPPKSFKKDYFVPHFGEDAEITSTKKNIAAAEKKYNHVYDTSPKPADPPRNYFVPHFGEDEDIKNTKSVIALTEKQMGQQVDVSDPPKDPPRNYFVPHFGEDEDITFTKRNIANAEKKNGAWNVKRDGNGAWILPGVEKNQYGNFKGENNWPSELMPSLVQVDSDMDAVSDPICSSAGCTQYKHKKKPRGYDINYPVPDFGVDHEIIASHASLDLAEEMKSHKLEMGTEKSKAKWHNPAKDVDYNFAPKLDQDIVATDKHLLDAE